MQIKASEFNELNMREMKKKRNEMILVIFVVTLS